MNNEEVKKARKAYRQTMKDNQKIIDIKNELKILEQDPQVKRYLQLSPYLSRTPLTQEFICRSIFHNYSIQTKSSSNLLVFMGSYIHNSDPLANRDTCVKENSPRTEYNLYMDFETEKRFFIPFHKVQEFEQNNLIIKFEILPSRLGYLEYYQKLTELQIQYYQELIHNNPEKSIAKIKKLANHN